MLRWHHLTPGFVGGGAYRVRRSFLYFVAELGAAGSSFFPAHCDETTGNHPNHFLLGFRAHALNSHTLTDMEKHNDLPASRTGLKAGMGWQNRAGREAGGRTGAGQGSAAGEFWPSPP